ERAAVLDADRHAVLRKAVDEVGGAIQRVDDPHDFRVRLRRAGFLGEQAVLGIALAHDVDDRFFGRLIDLRDDVLRALRRHAPVAFVVGNETAGLTNDEVFACQYLVHIPANPEFRSLNLAQAVQVVAYELRMCVDVAMPFARVEKRATVEDLEGLYAHLEEAATASGFMTPQSRLRERWRRLFSRVPAMEREEVNILRGLLKALMS